MMISREQMLRQRQVVIDTLVAGPADIHAIARALGLTKVAARRHVEPLRGKRVRISHWLNEAISGRKYPRPYYALGDEPDAPKPAPRHKPQKKRGKPAAPPPAPTFADPLHFWHRPK